MSTNEFEFAPLKRQPSYGVYRWWPEDGENWIHPFDIGVVRQLVPGNRVFRREDLDRDFLLVTYGDVQFRVRSTIWYEVAYEGFDVGETVEIKSRMGKAAPFIGRIKEMVWNHRYKHIEYYLYRSEKIQVKAYLAADMTPVDAIQKLGRAETTSPRFNGPPVDGRLSNDS